MLTIIRWSYVILGAIGIPPTAILLRVNWEIMAEAERKAERYIAIGFFVYSVALAILLVGQAAIALWQIARCAPMSLLPAIVQVGWLMAADAGLIAMCAFSMFLKRDRNNRRH